MTKKIIFIARVSLGISSSVLFAIKVYQKIFSPDRGLFNFLFSIGSCRFYPSCSCYTKEAVEKYGVLEGLFLGLKRIIRCNPLNRGGVDLLK